MRSNILFAITSLVAGISGPGLAAVPPERETANAAASFQLASDLRLDLVAQEPLVVSPCALAFDERARMFVVENRGYPVAPNPLGRIAMLEDIDGDGRYDKRTEFAADLSYPNGLLPWRGGWIVTCAPDVLFLKDTDGDGRADLRKVLLSGFSTTGSTQLRVSHPTLGLDNWIYLSGGLSAGSVISPLAPAQPPVEFKRSDLRFRPDTGEIQTVDGAAQFGMSFDDFGHRFICYNRVHVQHVVADSHWWRRNSNLAFSETVQNCPAEMIAPQLKGHGSAARIFPISRNITTADSHAGTFTAACAVTVCRDTALPAAYQGGVFSCDPTANLVHFDRLDPHGATFVARRVEPEREVLASTDDWFRPVFLTHAPDGALYLCDMYRKTIEHPDYLPHDVRKHTDFEGGKTMGRIYRLTSAERSSHQPLSFADATLDTLCHGLLSSNVWQRETAQRLLWDRRDENLVPRLTRLLNAELAKPTNAPGCIHLLSLLDSCKGVDDEVLLAAIRYPHPGLRESAIAIAAKQLHLYPDTAQQIVTAAQDDNARVRFAAALALGETNLAGAVESLAAIAVRDSDDRWTRAAVLSSLTGREEAFLDAAIQIADRSSESAEFFHELGRVLGARQSNDRWEGLLTRITVDWPQAPFRQQVPLLLGIAEGLQSRGKHAATGTFDAVLSANEAQAIVVRKVLHTLMNYVVKTAADASQSVEARRWSAALAGHADYEQVSRTLLELVDSRQPELLQAAAVHSLVSTRYPAVASELLKRDRFAHYTPRLREEILAALVTSTPQLAGVLDAVESNQIDVTDLDPSLRQQLVNSPQESVRSRAAKLLGVIASDRDKVYEDYRSVLQLSPHAGNGRAVFKRACAQCHRLDREGFTVGPDLFGIRNQPKEAILMHILLPDREITAGFRAYAVQTIDGRVLTGLISSETSTSITLRQALGKEDTLLRQDIEELIASKTSLMPQGLEKSIERQEFADLLAYLKGEDPDSSETTLALSNNLDHADNPIRLFNGKDLSGWYVYTENTKYDNPGVFQVVDGAIYVPGGKDDVAYYGGLITRDGYENYRLRFEFKWGERTYGRRKDRARDAGVLLHCLGPNGPGPWMNSFEFQIIEGGTGDMLIVNTTKLNDAGDKLQLSCTAQAEVRNGQSYYKPDAPPKEFVDRGRVNWWGRSLDWKDEVGFRGPEDVESPRGQWTRCEIIASGNELTYYVNDKLVNHIQNLSHTKGKLLFQTEGAEIWYRNIELTALTTKADSTDH